MIHVPLLKFRALNSAVVLANCQRRLLAYVLRVFSLIRTFPKSHKHSPSGAVLAFHDVRWTPPAARWAPSVLCGCKHPVEVAPSVVWGAVRTRPRLFIVRSSQTKSRCSQIATDSALDPVSHSENELVRVAATPFPPGPVSPLAEHGGHVLFFPICFLTGGRLPRAGGAAPVSPVKMLDCGGVGGGGLDCSNC